MIKAVENFIEKNEDKFKWDEVLRLAEIDYVIYQLRNIKNGESNNQK